MEISPRRDGHQFTNVAASDNAFIHNGDLYTGPVTVVGQASTANDVLEILGRIIGSAQALPVRDESTSSFAIFNLVSQLTAFRASLTKVQEWLHLGIEEKHHQLVLDLDLILCCCRALVERFDPLVSRLQSLSVRDSSPSKVSCAEAQAVGTLVFHELDELQRFLERQVSALNLLLTACNCKTTTQQNAFLVNKSTRKFIAKVQKDSASLIVHRGDSSSLLSHITDTGSKLSVKFAFDKKLWATEVYSKYAQRAMKSEIRSRQEGRSSLTSILPKGRPDEEVMAPIHAPGNRRIATFDRTRSMQAGKTPDQTSLYDTERVSRPHRQKYTIRLQGVLNRDCELQLLEYFKTAPQLKEYFIKVERFRDLRTVPYLNLDGDITVIVYFVDISAYDIMSRYKTLFDEASEHESFRELREHIDQSPYYRTPTLLHFTNVDEFARKLERRPMRDYFSDYSAGPGVEESIGYFLESFMAISSRSLLGMSLSRFAELGEPEMEVMASKLEELITGNPKNVL